MPATLPKPSPLNGAREIRFGLLLFGVLDGASFADYGDSDLTWETQLGLDPFGDVPRHQLGRSVVDLLRLDQDPDFAPGLDGVGLLDSLEGIRDLLQLLEPLDIGLQRLAARTRARSGDGVGCDQQKRLEAMRLLVVVVCAYGVHDRCGHSVTLKQVSPDHRMRALDLVVDGFADVVEKA